MCQKLLKCLAMAYMLTTSQMNDCEMLEAVRIIKSHYFSISFTDFYMFKLNAFIGFAGSLFG